ncbi:hypothetical protein [Prauserella alba]|uniref:Uncharacterized protein n=1 Tax=Prauserella alba TaxID=176898 RepID=A0ABN1VAH6_9PSEU|nr:hypothetical protein [Prauserella alba]MCP2179467.1 hypothetical protein [Prauserella alba]
MNRLREAWQRAVTAELCWTNPDGSTAAIAVTPVLRGPDPASATVCAALPYARAGEVEGLRSAAAAVFAVTDSRSLPGDAAAETAAGDASAGVVLSGIAAAGTVRIIDDLHGELFTEELLDQELVKYPPSRALADSVLLRRENWWWLPRIVVELTGSAAGAGSAGTMPLPARTDPTRHALLVGPAADSPEPPDTPKLLGSPELRRVPELHSVPELRCVDVGADVDDAPHPAVPSGVATVRELTDEPLPPAPGGALVFGYDYTMPDLERWEAWSLAGTVEGEQLAVDARTGSPGADLRTLGLLARTRRHRALAKACRAGVRAAERHPHPAP